MLCSNGHDYKLFASTLVMRIANETDLRPCEVRKIMLRMSVEIIEALNRGEIVELEGFGIFRRIEYNMSLARQNGKFTTLLDNTRRRPGRVMVTRLFIEPSIRELVRAHAKLTGADASYRTKSFSAEQCAEIRRQIASSEESIKGLARKLRVDRDVIRRIVRQKSDMAWREWRRIRKRIIDQHQNQKGT